MILKRGAILLAMALMVSCSDSSDDGAVGTTEEGSSADPETVNPMALLVPEGVTIPSFPTATSSSLRLVEDVEDKDANKSFAERVEDQKKTLRGEGTCLDLNVFKNIKEEAVTCYEFDSDMNPNSMNGNTYGTTTGKHDNGEACMVAFARTQMNSVKSMVDRAMGLTNAVACQAAKNTDTDIPAVGEEKDVAELLTSAGEDGAVALGLSAKEAPTISAATVKRDTETQFTTTISLLDPSGKEMTITVQNDSGEDGDSGVISISRAPQTNETQGDNGNNTSNKNFLMSIRFKQDVAAETLTAELRHAAILTTETQFNTDGTVALEELPDDATNPTVHAIKYVAFDMNTTTSAGQLSYWMNPGGGKDESARGFLFDLSDDDGVVAGCGVSGATSSVSIRGHLSNQDSDSYKLEPVRYWHPMGGASNTHPDKNEVDYPEKEGAKITKQCFKQDATSGEYLIDTDVTTADKGYEVIVTADSNIRPPRKPE